ncbi:MAG: GNAT family N-acetyltransferase [Bacteroidales bacterium]
MNVIHDAEKGVFCATVNGYHAEVKYKSENNKYYFYHTFVPKEIEGMGVAKSLVSYAISFCLEQDYTVVAICPYIVKLVRRNAGWKELVEIWD